jgi:hypothetical protein
VAESRLLSYDKLTSLLGLKLTDRRLRQLAKEGHFPEPIDGQYDWVATTQGLLKYYQNVQGALAARKQAIADEDHRKLKRLNDQAEGLLVTKAEVVAAMRQCSEPIRTLLRQKLENEYPMEVAGLDVPEARTYGKRLEDEILREFQTLFSKFDA